MGVLQRGQVEVGEDIAVQGEEAVLEPVAERLGGEADRPGGAAPVGLGHIGELDPAVLALAQRLAQLVGEEAAGEDRLGHPVGSQPLDHVGEEGPIDQRQRRLRDESVSGRRRVPSPPTRTIACI